MDEYDSRELRKSMDTLAENIVIASEELSEIAASLVNIVEQLVVLNNQVTQYVSSD